MTAADSRIEPLAFELACELAQLAAFRIRADDTCEWSREARRLLNIGDGSGLHALLARCATGRDRADFEQTLQKARGGEVSAQCDFALGSSPGQLRRFAARMKQQGAAREVVVVVQDRSRANEREEQLARAGESHERLQQLGRWSLLGEMASGLAHEINQPLAAISAFAQAGERMLGMMPPKVERAGSLFGEISGQALRAGDVVQRMRSLVKRQASSPQVLSCGQILTDFRSLAEPIARTHFVQLLVDQPEDELRVLMDPAHVQQVLISLFRNALDAMRDQPAAERQVRMEAGRSGEQIEIAMTDSGPGISDEVARELFRPFFTTKPEGTGLGLSVCRSIVAEHGGTLHFTNTGSGARFSILLPQAK